MSHGFSQMNTDHGLKHRDVTERVIKVFYEVYNELGTGFLESVYQNAMLIALTEAGLDVYPRRPIPVYFRGHVVGHFECDLIVAGRVLLELKAVRDIAPEHVAQTLNYLRATEIEVALLLNFGEKPAFKRLLYDNERKKQHADGEAPTERH